MAPAPEELLREGLRAAQLGAEEARRLPGSEPRKVEIARTIWQLTTAPQMMAGLAMQSTTAVGHSLLDHVLPVRVLSDTTPEERQHIADRLRNVQAPGYFSWMGAASVLLLSAYALWSANRLDRVQTQATRPHDTPTA